MLILQEVLKRMNLCTSIAFKSDFDPSHLDIKIIHGIKLEILN